MFRDDVISGVGTSAHRVIFLRRNLGGRIRARPPSAALRL